MTAPVGKLVSLAATELQEAYPHSFRLRSDAEDAARIALAACHVEEMREALRKALKWMEDAEVQIESEWGSCRSLDQLQADGDLSDEIVMVRALLAKMGD